jgi:hypothetical protein
MIFDFLKNLLGDSFEDNSTSQNTLWSKEELDEFKSILIEEKGITISEIEYLEERIKDIEQYKINQKT